MVEMVRGGGVTQVCVCGCVCVVSRGDLEVSRVQEGGLDEKEPCRWSGLMEREAAGVEEAGGMPWEGRVWIRDSRS